MTSHSLTALCTALLALSAPVGLAAQSVDHATASHAEELGPLTTDRPGMIENPFTVARGHFQVESNLAGYTRFGKLAPEARAIDAAQVRLRAGIARGFEAQVVFNGYAWERDGSAPWARSSGGGTARLKVLLRDDEHGGFGLGLIPAVTMTRDHADDWQATFALTAAATHALPAGWEFGAAGGVAKSPEATGGFGVVSVAHALTGPVLIAFEAAAIREELKHGTTEGRVGAALMFALGSSAQFDVGIDVGVANKANAYRTYVGMARRF